MSSNEKLDMKMKIFLNEHWKQRRGKLKEKEMEKEKLEQAQTTKAL